MRPAGGVRPKCVNLRRRHIRLRDRFDFIGRIEEAMSGLAQEPEAFASNPCVAHTMVEFGDAALPLTLVNGEVLVRGRYPTRDELANALAPSGRGTGDHAIVPNACCAPGSGCC